MTTTEPKPALAYCAVRKNPTGEPRLDVSTQAETKVRVLERVTVVNERIPAWAKRNPVIRITKVRVEEVRE